MAHTYIYIPGEDAKEIVALLSVIARKRNSTIGKVTKGLITDLVKAELDSIIPASSFFANTDAQIDQSVETSITE